MPLSLLKDKGTALESLMETLFTQVPGFAVYGRDLHTATEELDLVILNGSSDPVFSRERSIIIVECKNWTTARPGRPEFSQVVGKMKSVQPLQSCIFRFVARGSLGTTFSSKTLRMSQGNYLIVRLTGSDIRQAVVTDSFPE